MTNTTVSFKMFFSLLAFCMLISLSTFAQVEGRQPFPYEIQNHTPYADNEVYVAIVGEDLSSVPGNHIWVDCKTGATKMMDRSYNTINGPVYIWLGAGGTGPGYDEGMLARNDQEGNRGPFNDAMYADCFTKLSDIPNKTVMLPLIQACRVFFSFKSQLYLCFRGSSPTPGMFSGYTAPAITDYTDPNQAIMWDMIELTYDKYGYFANTSRVDSYNIPMGMESVGMDMQWDATGKLIVDANGKAILVKSTKQIGEKKTHLQIQAAWAEYTKGGSGREEFANCIKPKTGAIVAPGKIKDFADGTIGTMPVPGPYVNYYKSYIDKVWSTYSSKNLVFDSGDAGVWTGRVTGETFTFTCDKAWGTAKGIITRKPTTQEVLEGKGCLDEDVQKIAGQQLDRVVQAQLCAALNRHVVPVDGEVLPKSIPTVLKNGKTALDFSKSEFFYQVKPSNYYAAFWHQGNINMNDKAYGFCYDDVWNYASGAPSFMPEKVTIHLDGWAKILDVQAVVTPENQTINAPASSATLDGSKSSVKPDRDAYKTFSWTLVLSPAGSNPTIAAASSAITTISGLAKGQTKVKLTVGDGLKTSEVITTITVTSNDPCDISPIVIAGSNQNVSLSGSYATALLKATATDPLQGTVNRGNITFSWIKISGPNGDNIVNPSALETSLTNLTVGQYIYEVKATIASNCGSTIEAKSQVKITVNDSPIIIPCGGSVVGTNNTGFDYLITSTANPVITFVPVDGKSKAPVVIHYRVNGGSEGGYNSFSGMNFTITAKIGDKIEFYYVYTLPAGGEANSSASWTTYTVGTECMKPIGLESTKELSAQTKLYPNPANSSITIELPEGVEISSAQIINSMGSVVLGNIQNKELSMIDISQLAHGVYFIQLIGDQTVVKKFIKK